MSETSLQQLAAPPGLAGMPGWLENPHYGQTENLKATVAAEADPPSACYVKKTCVKADDGQACPGGGAIRLPGWQSSVGYLL